MTDEPTMKLTDFDYLTGDHHLQMLKAALPYVNVSEQKFLSVLVKCQELRRTISLFDEEETATLGICSLGESAPRSPIDMLEAMKPYGNTQEQDFLDLVVNFLQGFRLGNQYQEMKAQEAEASNFSSGSASHTQSAAQASHDGHTASNTPHGADMAMGTVSASSGAEASTSRRPSLEQLKAFLPPEQQARFETMSMLMQAVQQFT